MKPKPKPTPAWPFPRTLANKCLPPAIKAQRIRKPRQPQPLPPTGPAAPF